MSEHRLFPEVALAPMAVALVMGSTFGAAAQNAQNSQDMQNMPGMSHPAQGASQQGNKTKANSGKANNNGSQAAAGGGALQVSDVVVEVDRGEKRMMEVMMKKPRQGDVVTGRQAREQQITTLSEFAQKVPSYQPNTTSPHFTRMGIRGLGMVQAGASSAGVQSETGFVVDDVPWIQGEYQWGDWTNIESFEIAYGPGGTFGGKNSDVGVVYINTPLPSFARKTQVESSFCNYNRVTEKIDTTGPINDNLAYRVSGYYDRADGWIHDIYNGQSYDNINRYGIRAQLFATGWGFTDRFIVGYQDSDEITDYGMGAGSGTASALIGDSFLTYANGTKPALTYFQTLQAKFGPGFKILTRNPYAPALGMTGTDPVHVPTVSNEATFDIGKYKLTSISAFGYFANQMNGNTDNEGLWIGAGTNDMDSYGLQASEELRLSSPKGERLEWTTGLYSPYETPLVRMHHTDFGPDAAKWLGFPSTYASLAGLKDWFGTSVKDAQIAGYANATYHVTDKFSLTAGVRNSYDYRYDKTSYAPQYVDNPYGITQAQQLAYLKAAGSCGYCSTGSQTTYHNGVTLLVNPHYQWNEHVLLYTVFGRGDKAAAANNGSLINPAIPSLGNTPYFSKPTRSLDYEVGAKTNWFDGQLISNINFYWNDLWNYQAVNSDFYTNAAGQELGVQYMGNAEHVRLRGIEFIDRWDPPVVPGLDLHVSAAYQEARYITYTNSPDPIDYLYAGGPASINLSNTRMTGIPWWTFNVGLDYSHPVGQVFQYFGGLAHDHGAWTLRSFTAFTYANLDWFNHEQLTNPRSVYQYWQPAYALVNAGVGLRTDDDNYAFTLWVKNATNVRPYTAFTVGNSTTPAAVGLTEQGPRYFGASLLVTFN